MRSQLYFFSILLSIVVTKYLLTEFFLKVKGGNLGVSVFEAYFRGFLGFSDFGVF